MITAQQVKEKAQKVNTDNSSGQLFKINNIISNAASRGEYFIWYYETINKDVIEELKHMGYDIGERQFERNEMVIKISWDKK